MLVIRVEYLTGVCMATRHNDPSRSTPEWPPHPDRLYSALVAAAAESTDSDDEARTHILDAAKCALQWLAKQGAPQLAVSEARWRSAPEVHVPTNPHPTEIPSSVEPGPRARDREKRRSELADAVRNLLPVHRKKAALPIPAVVPDDPVVYFIWPNADAKGPLEVLRGICERVTYLGRSRSLVRVSVVDDPPRPTLVPDPLGQVQLRMPGPNRLQDLIDNYELKGGKPPPCPPRRYRRVELDLHRPETPHSVFDSERMYIFKPQSGDPALPAVSTLKVTQALRRALLSHVHDQACGCERWKEGVPRCEDAPECYRKIPTVISGYEPDGSPTKRPHIAFVGLPFVHPNQRHADGTIKGLAVLVPRNPDDQALLALADGLMRLQDGGLGIPGIGTWQLKEVAADDPPLLTLDSRTWTRPSRVWTTTTPAVFGHFPKPNKGGEARVVLDSLRMIDAPEGNASEKVERLSEHLVEIAIGRHSPLHGVSPSWCFKTCRDRESNGQPPRFIRHVTLRFDRAVRGPIVLGCLRYFGLGLMRPLEES